MPIIESAKKRVRVAEKKRKLNRARKDELKNAIQDFEEITETASKEEAEEKFKETVKIIDRAASKGIIHKNNAARKKSRLAKILNNM